MADKQDPESELRPPRVVHDPDADAVAVRLGRAVVTYHGLFSSAELDCVRNVIAAFDEIAEGRRG